MLQSRPGLLDDCLANVMTGSMDMMRQVGRINLFRILAKEEMLATRIEAEGNMTCRDYEDHGILRARQLLALGRQCGVANRDKLESGRRRQLGGDLEDRVS